MSDLAKHDLALIPPASQIICNFFSHAETTFRVDMKNHWKLLTFMIGG
jgi:hypothetical protein